MKIDIDLNHEEVLVQALLPQPKLKTSREKRQYEKSLPEILFVTSYPPRECGIATYSQDLLKALNNKFSNSFSLKVCALEAGLNNHTYPEEVKYTLDTTNSSGYGSMVKTINDSQEIKLVMVQHEFGFFEYTGEDVFLKFIYEIAKPVILVFHTVIPNPSAGLKMKVRHIAATCASIVVMTKNSAAVLKKDYGIDPHKIIVIPHGTHLVPHLNKEELKEKFGLNGRKVLSTFGLLSSGKGIDTTLNAMPAIIRQNPDVAFLVIGKTHPGVVQYEGEKYRAMLEEKVEASGLFDHVKFINRYLPLQDLLEYLQLTDIYLFTSTDPNQAVSGTFSYAMSCGCPIISTPIPHAKEVLREDTGIIIDFKSDHQLAEGVNMLLGDDYMRKEFSSSTLQRIVPTAWENSAISHALLLRKVAGKALNSDGTQNRSVPIEHQTNKIRLQYRLPEVNLDHIQKMTTEVGMIQFSIINQPDLGSGYTLDDNARAMISICMHYAKTGDVQDLKYLKTYLEFIAYCQQPEGDFLNYVDSDRVFTPQNQETNLSDSNGRAIWALGYLISKKAWLPSSLVDLAESILTKSLPRLINMHSTRSMAFAIKGLYFSNIDNENLEISFIIKTLANRLLQMYRHEADEDWKWYESYLTYANSLLPEALLYAWLETGNPDYKETAKASFDFLLEKTFNNTGIKVISNKTWLHKGSVAAQHGEQPIDVAYTILALAQFYKVFKDESYLQKIETAFNWFLGNNHLHQIIYNPCTGGCYDGLEATHVNLNQGAESTVSYLMARLTVEPFLTRETR